MTAATSQSVCINFQTDSTTSAYSEGQIVGLDSSGNITAVTVKEDTQLIGVIAKGKRATSSAEQWQVAVQVGGVADVLSFVADTNAGSGYDQPIVPGDAVLVDGSDRVVGYGGSTGASATQAADVGAMFAIALEANAGSTAADTTAYIKVLLKKG